MTDAWKLKIGTRVSVSFEGIVTSNRDIETVTVKSEDGFAQIVNLDYPGVVIKVMDS